ncbi:E3 22.5 kDa [simian adenovirus 22]|uniref:E3 22.5 kDa n=1 Tax=simian adenovirus 22 TaxID=175569 RepID=Q6QPG7_9ADEN|nr:E3 22.5 kDa [Simian adenovirus E22]
MASVKFLLLFASLITVISNEKLTIYIGTNHTLDGIPKSSWYCYFDQDPDLTIELCGNKGKNTSIHLINFNCGDNLKLINITKEYGGMYYYVAENNNMQFYEVTVTNPTTPRTTTTTTTKTTPVTTMQLTTNNIFAMRQMVNNSTQPTPPSEEIPKSMIGIIVAVVVCMLIIALCMVYYAFCYRKHRLNDKLEHLLSVEF